MSVLQAFVLALIQGITEFLPISSSAHLILVPHLFGWADQGLTFDIITNAGTLLAVILYFRRDLWALLRQPLRGVAAMSEAGSEDEDEQVEDGQAEDGQAEKVPTGDAASKALENGDGGAPLAGLIAVATVPVVAAGLLFYGWISTAGRDPRLIAGTSILFGLLLWLADHRGARSRRLASLGWLDALLVGLAQALALVPGTSRSGATITAGLALGFNRRAAARFSFLIAIPVSLAALLHDVKDLVELGAGSSDALLPYLVGFVVSAVSAFAVIGWLLDWVERQSLDLFVAYRVLLGVVILGLPLVD